jgi:aspartyl-tRNA(Asn)/glutamyl-tRNA(Gln) amidotransferase subunit A
VPFSIGSDTGGSVRQPAAFCGVLGLKPTYGAISRYGMVALASSMDCVGIVSQSARDALTVLSVIGGRDARDATSYDLDLTVDEGLSMQGLRVATVPEMTAGEIVSEDVREAMRRAEALFVAQGAVVENVSLPTPDKALAAYCVLSAAEISSNMARFDGIRFGMRKDAPSDLFSLYADSRAMGFGDEVKRRILFGTHLLTEENRKRYYDRARAVVQEIRRRMCDIFSDYDVILSPVAPSAAFRHHEYRTPAEKRRADLCSVYANLAGLPAFSVPFGKNAQGLPLAIQLTSAPFTDARLLRVAGEVQRIAGEV